MSSKFDKAVGVYRESVFRFGKVKKPSLIKKIGYQWSPFGAIEGDSAKRVDTGDDSIYLILYKTPKGKFDRHFHLVRESATVLKGSIKLITAEKEEILHESDTYICEIDAAHEVHFISEGEHLLSIQFHPPFESGDWEAGIDG